VPSLDRLLAGPHAVVVVVSQPDRRRGRGRRRSPSPVAERALAAGLPLLRPERVGEAEVVAEIARHAPDLGVVVAFGQFLPKRVRELPALGYSINGHASLLPRHRGAAPIQRAILAGDTVTGVSVMRVEREMDAGPVALQRRLVIGPDENAGELAGRVAELTAHALVEVVDRIATGRVTWTPQDDAAATAAPKLERAEAELDWSESAEALTRRVRAFAPTPGGFTRLAGEPLRILAARAEPGSDLPPPGTVRSGGDPPLRIATGKGWLVPLLLQRSGGKALATADFLRGRPIRDGTTLG
jgi:methionyl-tRNA formyltransferase